jgi:hypothetical protein
MIPYGARLGPSFDFARPNPFDPSIDLPRLVSAEGTDERRNVEGLGVSLSADGDPSFHAASEERITNSLRAPQGQVHVQLRVLAGGGVTDQLERGNVPVSDDRRERGHLGFARRCEARLAWIEADRQRNFLIDAQGVDQ